MSGQAATDEAGNAAGVSEGPGRSLSAGLASAAADNWPTLALLAAVLVAWEALIRLLQVSAFVVPAPSAVFRTLAAKQTQLLDAAWITGGEVLLGFFFSAITGIAVALVIARFDRFGRALYPLVVLFQTVPKVALAPIFILWFGYDLAPKIMLIVVIAFFPVALDMLAGLQSIDPSLVALMRSVGAGRTEILRRVQIPHSLPHLMSGLKIAITFSVIGAVVGEFAGASAGLGYMIQFASTQLDTPLVFAALLEVSVLGVVFFYVVELAERRFVSWVPRYERGHR
ncbi:MAG: transporter permease [Rhodospirillales bacterium]|nr:transporter permease [Rhodospirillales bacterium]